MALGDGIISVKLDLSPAAQKLLRQSWTPRDGYELITALDRESAENFKEQLATQRGPAGPWKPLSPAYTRRKQYEGKPPQIWQYSGATARSLTTPMTVKGAVGNSQHERRIVVTENNASRVSYVTIIRPPAAGGWFAKNNAVRMIMDALPHRLRRFAKVAEKFYARRLASMGFKVRGSADYT